MALQFGIFRRLPGMAEKEVFHLDPLATKEKLFEYLLHNLPEMGEKKVLRKAKPRVSWSQEEIKKAFNMAWAQLRRDVQLETLRIR